MSGLETHSTTVAWQSAAGDLRLSFELPSSWTWSVVSAPKSQDASGRLPMVLTANNAHGRQRLRVAAARISPPLGIVPAAVYWAQLHDLPDVPEDRTPWSRFSALGGWFALPNNTTVAAVWLQAHASVVEFRLDGPADDEPDLKLVWQQLQESLSCVAFDEATPARQQPSWWARAQQMRAQDRLDDAIALIEREGDQAEMLLMQADLHIERMRRALAAGDVSVAQEAWTQAHNCAYAYAASATSGGEGAARSIQRDRLLQELGPRPD